MMRYLQARLGERSTIYGFIGAVALLILSFFVPVERGDIADVMRALAIPIAVGLFLWRDEGGDA
jgi:hypothetical protein